MRNEVKKGNGKKALRDTAILRLLYDLGLRRGELVALDLENPYLDNGFLAIRRKGRTQKINLRLPDQTKAVLEEWSQVRGVSRGPLFIKFDHAGKGKRLTGASIYRTIQELGRKANINVRSHGLRHNAITEALEATGRNIRAVARSDVRVFKH